MTNTIRYAAARGEPYLFPAEQAGAAAVQGMVATYDGRPLPYAVVLVAEPQGTPHVTRANQAGEYRLQGLPAGNYIPVAVAAGFEEAVLRNRWGMPWSIQLERGQSIVVPEIALQPLVAPPLGPDAAARSALEPVASYTATSPYPEGATAQVRQWTFQRNETVNDTLFVYLPPEAAAHDARLPLLFALYPGHSLMWEDVSVAFASRGYAVVALSPLAGYGRNVIEHGEDARLALHLARSGDLGDAIDGEFPLAISGSYGAAVLNRMLRLEPTAFTGVALLGGISNAFSGAAAFYAGNLVWPPALGYALAALGTANAKPDNFMRFSPVYTAEVMPPTLLLHARADNMVPIQQSQEYAAALKEAAVPVQTYYFADEGHYIQVGEDTSLTTRRVFLQILSFLQKQHSSAANRPFALSQSVTLSTDAQTG